MREIDPIIIDTLAHILRNEGHVPPDALLMNIEDCFSVLSSLNDNEKLAHILLRFFDTLIEEGYEPDMIEKQISDYFNHYFPPDHFAENRSDIEGIDQPSPSDPASAHQATKDTAPLLRVNWEIRRN